VCLLSVAKPSKQRRAHLQHEHDAAAAQLPRERIERRAQAVVRPGTILQPSEGVSPVRVVARAYLRRW
jgi:hypothetical protein